MRLVRLTLLLFILIFSTTRPTAQTPERPFILPVQGDPGPATWLFGQAYGNTTGAFNFGTEWYSAGQGLHFGIDLPMPCGTPLVAMADGEVAFSDNLSFGSGPHNLLILHPEQQVIALYGHLLQPPSLMPGDPVRQGEVIALSGDPDETCDSRPHLHLEIRGLNYRTALNPFEYIQANWHMLASLPAFGTPLFQGDMMNARRWMSLEDQPDTAFGGARLNAYGLAWPLPNQLRPPSNPALNRPFSPIEPDASVTLRTLGYDQCCWQRWWHPSNPDLFYVIDGQENQRAGVFEWSAATGVNGLIGEAPPAVTSPDGAYQIFNNGAQTVIRRVSDGSEVIVNTNGATPALSTDNSKLVWTVRGGASVPGQAAPASTVYVSNLEGTNTRAVIAEPGASASWLDADRLLVSIPQPGRITTLSVFDTRNDSRFDLGTWRNIRALSIAPGGGRLMYMLQWQEDTVQNGIWTMETTEGAVPQQIPWFGGWRWRDSESVFYLPLDVNSAYHTLAYYHIPTGENRVLVTPDELAFTIMNGDWDVSADGRRILFMNATDRNMAVLEIASDQ
jgi:murein DD-endopeptidase MepM/ murein hydrolase activator NlpD